MRVRIKKGWANALKVGSTIGPPVIVHNQRWMPVVWDGEDDPDWHKEAGLEEVNSRMEIYISLIGSQVIERREIPVSNHCFPDFVLRNGKYFRLIKKDFTEVVYQETNFRRT